MIGIRYVRPMDVTVEWVTTACICGFSASAHGPEASKQTREAFNAHLCQAKSLDTADEKAQA